MTRRLYIAILLMTLSSIAKSQDFVYAIKNHDFVGYSIFTLEGKMLYTLPLYAQPVTTNSSTSGIDSYSNAIVIPLKEQKFPVEYGDSFYILDLNGHIVNKLHPNTEWVYNWTSAIPRISLKNYPHENEFRDMYIDANGKPIFNSKIFMDADDFLNGYAPIKSSDHQWKLINENGDVVKNISDQLVGKSRSLYNAFTGIWSYRLDRTFEEWFITLNGKNSRDLTKLIQEYHQLEIPEYLISTKNAIKISRFIQDKNQPYIFLPHRNDEGRFVQSLYDKSFHAVELDRPDEPGKYLLLRYTSNDQYIYGIYSPKEDKADEYSVIIDKNLNKIIYKSEQIISQLSENSILYKEGDGYLIKDFENNLLHRTTDQIKNEYVLIEGSSIEDQLQKIDSKTKTLVIKSFDGQQLPPAFFSVSESIETLVFIECRKLVDFSQKLDQLTNLKHLGIIRCNLLKNYNPLSTDSLQLHTFFTGDHLNLINKELVIRNKTSNINKQ